MLLPEPVTVSEALKLVPGVKQKSPQAIEKAITGHMQPVFRYASTIARAYPRSKREDIILEAFLALTRAVNNFSNVNHHQLTFYILSCVKFAIQELMIHDNLVYVPNESKQRVTIEPLVMEPITMHTSMVEVNDLIEHVTNDPIEKQIVQLRMLGYNDVDIGYKLGVKADYIGEIRRNIGISFKIKG
jgi:DNA-directed RNA polymerase specialized sigma subunit